MDCCLVGGHSCLAAFVGRYYSKFAEKLVWVRRNFRAVFSGAMLAVAESMHLVRTRDSVARTPLLLDTLCATGFASVR